MHSPEKSKENVELHRRINSGLSPDTCTCSGCTALLAGIRQHLVSVTFCAKSRIFSMVLSNKYLHDPRLHELEQGSANCGPNLAAACFLGNTTRLAFLCIVHGCFCTTVAKMRSCSQDLTAKNLCYLVLNKKSKPTAEVDPGSGGGTSKQSGVANQNRGRV